MRTRLAVLALSAQYLPGYRAGGPIRSLANLVQVLGDEFDFKIVTSDRDLGSSSPYPGISTGVWQQVGKAQVIYVDSNRRQAVTLFKILQQTSYDVLYLNSFFSRPFSMLPVWLHNARLRRRTPVLLAPRGEFAPDALTLKRWRKRAYMRLAFALRLYRRVYWHASSEFERTDILRVLPRPNPDSILLAGSVLGETGFRTNGDLKRQDLVVVAPDVTTVRECVDSGQRRMQKAVGELRLVVLARVARMKNLASALNYLTALRGLVTFDLYGPVEDESYWQQCRTVIDRLPGNIRVMHRGEISHDEVDPTLAQYDLFLLPTLGENFGHAIIEALAASCPVLISDRTPWRNLESARAGFALPLEEPGRFSQILQFFVDMDEAEHRTWRAGACEYAAGAYTMETAVTQNRRLFAAMAKAAA